MLGVFPIPARGSNCRKRTSIVIPATYSGDEGHRSASRSSPSRGPGHRISTADPYKYGEDDDICRSFRRRTGTSASAATSRAAVESGATCQLSSSPCSDREIVITVASERARVVPCGSAFPFKYFQRNIMDYHLRLSAVPISRRQMPEGRRRPASCVAPLNPANEHTGGRNEQ